MKIRNKLQQKEWEKYYQSEKLIHIKPKVGFFISYDIYLCDFILERFLPKSIGNLKHKLKICEIGCGDGRLLKKIADRFGYEPYGIEYSQVAARKAERAGINVILTDAFSREIKRKYQSFFDIVLSYGFVEHIFPPEKAVKLHIDLLKDNGYLVIQIPRFKGFNLWKAKIFRPDLIPLHNLEIMEEEKLHNLLAKFDVKEIYCKDYGTLKLRLPMDKRNIRYYFLKVISSLEYFFNPLLRSLFGSKGLETKFFSPAIMFIGKK